MTKTDTHKQPLQVMKASADNYFSAFGVLVGPTESIVFTRDCAMARAAKSEFSC